MSALVTAAESIVTIACGLFILRALCADDRFEEFFAEG